MSYQFIIMPDPEESFPVSSDTTFFAYDNNQVTRAIRDVSAKNPQATICVYSLSELHKLKDHPTYQKYVVKNDEVLPV